MNTNGQICFGHLFDEGTEFPWGTDPAQWWRDVNGFVDKHQPWTPEGAFAKGWVMNDPRFNERCSLRKEWDEAHPIPFEEVNVCSIDYPIYVLAVPGTLTSSYHGEPVEFSPAALPAINNEEFGRIKTFIAFLAKHDIVSCMASDLKWYLSSLWA